MSLPSVSREDFSALLFRCLPPPVLPGCFLPILSRRGCRRAGRPIPPAPAPSQARIAVDKPPIPRRRIKPEYPRGARARGEEGDVTLELDISESGTVNDVRIIASCGFAELEQAAIQTVKHARFTPARRGNSKVPATARLTLTFRLKD